MGSAVQQEAMQCYYLKFQPQDHSFLLQSNVFSNISKALSFPEEIPQETQDRRSPKDKVCPMVLLMLLATMVVKALLSGLKVGQPVYTAFSAVALRLSLTTGSVHSLLIISAPCRS